MHKACTYVVAVCGTHRQYHIRWMIIKNVFCEILIKSHTYFIKRHLVTLFFSVEHLMSILFSEDAVAKELGQTPRRVIDS